MSDVQFRSTAELEAGLDYIRQAPKELTTVALIVRRPKVNERELLQEAQLDCQRGLIGDSWSGERKSPPSDTSTQLTLMNARSIDLVAGSKDRWSLAGDQIFLDFDLSSANLPPGSQLSLGSAIIEISPEPHTGCRKFVARFGIEAMRFVNSKVGRELNLRGVNARILRGGRIHVGDTVQVLSRAKL